MQADSTAGYNTQAGSTVDNMPGSNSGSNLDNNSGNSLGNNLESSTLPGSTADSTPDYNSWLGNTPDNNLDNTTDNMTERSSHPGNMADYNRPPDSNPGSTVANNTRAVNSRMIGSTPDSRPGYKWALEPNTYIQNIDRTLRHHPDIPTRNQLQYLLSKPPKRSPLICIDTHRDSL